MATPDKIRLHNSGLIPDYLDIERTLIDKLYLRPEYGINFAPIIALTTNGLQMLEATASNALKVASVGSGLEEYSVLSGTGDDSFNDINRITKTEPFTKINFLIETYDAVIRFRDKTDISWMEEIILPKGFYSFDHTTRSVQIRNRTAGQDTTYQIVVFF